MSELLSPLERRVYHYLLDFLAENTYQPSVREIGRRFKIKSTKTVAELLQSLAEKGYIEREGARSRGVRIVGFSSIGHTQPVPLYSRVNAGSIPVQDVGLIDAVRKGRVEIVAAVEAFEDGKVVLADGERLGPDAVIAATGYLRGLEDLVGHLDVLDAHGRPVVHGARAPKNAPGLFFNGYTNPISGMLRELAIDAAHIAKAVVRHRR